jgi:hypothetical protein
MIERSIDQRCRATTRMLPGTSSSVNRIERRYPVNPRDFTGAPIKSRSASIPTSLFETRSDGPMRLSDELGQQARLPASRDTSPARARVAIRGRPRVSVADGQWWEIHSRALESISLRSSRFRDNSSIRSSNWRTPCSVSSKPPCYRYCGD